MINSQQQQDDPSGDYWRGIRPRYPSQTQPNPAPSPAAPAPPKAPGPLQPPNGTGNSNVTTQSTLAPVSPVLPAPSSPYGPPNLATPSLSNNATGQTAPATGSPQGYDITKGIDTSLSGLLPQGFNIGTLTNGGTIPDAQTPGANDYTNQEKGQLTGPSNWNVTAPQTVAGQYAALMANGGANPAIQAAEQSVIRANAARGGANDLMAGTAASLAGSQVALQIAQQDAQVNAAAGQFNANAANQFAQQQNQFIQNATLSQQNFQQGVAMLKDQTNQSMQQLYAQVQAGAATASVNMKATLGQIQAQTNSTIETMDKQFAQSFDTLNLQQSFADQNAWTQYGMNVRTSYLASVNQQQTSLMQTIAEIRQNPNINQTQADAAIQDAVSQFNSFMNMNNAYYSSMVPSPGTTSTNYNAKAWPNG